MDDETKRKFTQLNYKRGSLKTQLTLFSNYLSPLIITSTAVNDEVIKNVSRRLDKIQPVLESFEDIQLEIEMLDPENESNIIERESFQNIYFDLSSKAENLIAKYHEIAAKNESQSDVQSNHTRTSGGSGFQINNVKLPRIDIPKFDGTFTAWRQFADVFTTIIHNNPDLPNCHKLCYLRTSLKGEPANMINTLETTDANYEIAWNSLKDRYDNKRRIVYNHIHSLLNLNEIQKESHSNLRQFLDELQSHSQCLNSLIEPTQQWDSLMISIALKKLDSRSVAAWESKINSEHDNEYLPKYEDLIEFLKKRQGILEAIQTTNPVKPNSKSDIKPKPIKAYASVNKLSCAECTENHFIHNCESYLKLDPANRFQKAKTLKLCTNCLKKGHYASACQSSSCRVCHKKHHTTLHTNSKTSIVNSSNSKVEQTQSQNVNNTPNSDATEQRIQASCSALNNSHQNTEVLLATALVNVTDDKGNLVMLRAILDSAAQSNFISEKACKLLNLKQEPANLLLTGITQNCTNIRYNITLKIASRCSKYEADIICGVLPRVSMIIPNAPLMMKEISIPSDLQLADPSFKIPGEIDLLIGGSLFWQLLRIGKVKCPNGLTFFNTQLGWVVTGEIASQQSSKVSLLSLTTLNAKLEEFWKIDDIPQMKQNLTPEEDHCEKLFTETTTRAADGKFVVKYPWKSNYHELGNSLEAAKERFFSLERRFAKDEAFRCEYSNCLKEYLSEKHAEVSTIDDDSFYLPHHAVIKTDSTTTKLRIVFDGSCKLDSGLSVNQIQNKGPVVQNDLIAIILNFRMHRYVLTGDIARMYRQIWIHNDDRKFQKILWRDDPSKPLQCIQLNTVTFGMTAAPYLATRCVLELAQINKNTYPIESEIMKDSFYVDDCLTGAESIEDLKIIQQNLIEILQKAGFPLRKFRSNIQELDEREDNYSFAFSAPDSNKALGIIWNPRDDEFRYSLLEQNTSRISKRIILSMTAQLWDPLGLLAPIIILAKLIIQDIWKLNIDWDDDLPAEIQQTWLKFRYDLKEVRNIIVTRHVIITNATVVELHGFSDASERAYGCCIYIKSVNANNECQINLLIAKSRVAPVKTISLPRLELLAATLLADLMSRVKQKLKFEIHKEFYWTDSMIVLAWLQAHPSKWATFVANRVSTIQSVSEIKQWHHVRSESNPADLISRGVLPSSLVEHDLWWKGPEFLSDDLNSLNSKEILLDEIPETKSKVIRSLIIVNEEFLSLLTNHSKLSRAVRILAWCVRFINNARIKEHSKKNSSEALLYSETTSALCLFIKLIQQRYLSEDYELLLRKEPLNQKNSILNLSPFLDESGLIRVGGRLSQSQFSFDKRYPILLPKHNRLTDLLFEEMHVKLLHAGTTALLNAIREKYWPIAGRSAAKKVLKKCIKCVRFNPAQLNPRMGDLPKSRVTIMPPFTNVGVDYAGPIIIKDKVGRGCKQVKAYIGVFICFSVKAIHLEIISSLSAEAFLAAFRRFIARRGKPLNVYSDNGTNFRGANSELKEFYKELSSNRNLITDSLVKEGVNWHFIPPHSPHFGGLWEAGVKSVKGYLRKILANTLLTYEELSTVIAQIEAILNSRPLCPLSSDPNDLQALTPAHFLIGHQYTALVDPNVTDLRLNRLSRFQYLQRLNQEFWKRWSCEYISELQRRTKWMQKKAEMVPDSLVLVKEDGSPPATWKLGRVVEVYPGLDGVVRVVDVRCGGSVMRRPVVKLCVLPVEPHG